MLIISLNLAEWMLLAGAFTDFLMEKKKCLNK